MKRRRGSPAAQVTDDVEGALAALSAEELREMVREMLPELEERARGLVLNNLIDRAAGGGSGWVPAALSSADIAEILGFCKAARRVGYAGPAEVDEYLRRGSCAFLRQDYATAFRIFGALLQPLGDGEIHLGQDEMLDEVLGVDAGKCAAQYLVAAYMISAPEERAAAVRSALEDVRALGFFTEPVRDMEGVAPRPLPGIEEFLPRWRAIIEKEVCNGPSAGLDREEAQWLREVVRLLEGTEGLAKMARSTKNAGDFRAWCQNLVEAGDWKAALPAFEEAAELTNDKKYAKGEFLDGAALAAHEIGCKDLPGRLERAWRAGPTMLRLRRWIGSTRGKAKIKERAGVALAACPKRAHRQRAFLHVLLGDFEPAAKLLASAPGLGWSDSEHPGHLLFPLFQSLLGSRGASLSSRDEEHPGLGTDIEELEILTADPDTPRLEVPEVDKILEQAGVVAGAEARGVLSESMRKAAERRVAGVTGNQRRRHYGHAAILVASCVAVDPSASTAHWLARLRDQYRRYPALRSELDRHLKAP